MYPVTGCSLWAKSTASSFTIASPRPLTPGSSPAAPAPHPTHGFLEPPRSQTPEIGQPVVRQAHLVIGDGADGCPGRALFDRVHVTCGIRRVPYTWVEQTRPGGIIVLPWCPEFGTDHALRLTVMPDGTAHGRFPGFASYMPIRSQRMPAWHADDRTGHRSTTRIDPRTIGDAPAGADLARAAISGLRAFAEDDYGYRLWVVDTETPSRWAAVTYQTGADEFEVYQLGDRAVWDEVTDAYFRWVAWGEPAESGSA
ncbi:hypothetical protein [Spongiactinospora sp. TRM90649]|uniref:hypothetical protein n=1 Tax=Spongiactinospora sp. TRM90649 TaxID=3031114 RepID=UPI0023F830C8|nr:hypothetical protein [Spongiactinospora sp. TRM90649]MDF5752425.1 hypothetical protein [Spongiactinospora sp. TRM90649]